MIADLRFSSVLDHTVINPALKQNASFIQANQETGLFVSISKKFLSVSTPFPRWFSRSAENYTLIYTPRRQEERLLNEFC